MAGDSRTLKLSILADVDNLNTNLKKASTDVDGFGDKLGKFGKVAAAAFAAAAVAAAAYAVKIGVDGVKAAIEDEAAQVRLAGALERATGATKEQVAAVEQQILKTSLATGVADDQLRPALARLAVSTGDTAKAQDLLNLALDASQATGKPLETVANAIGKAYDGNTTALGKLGIGLSTAELKTMSFTDVQNKLSELFGGAAAKNAETFQGRLDRLKIGLNEAKETIGFALLPILTELVGYISKYILPIVEQLSGAFAGKAGNLSDTIKDVVDTVKSFLIPIFDAARGVFDKMKATLEENKDEFMKFWDVVKFVAPLIGEAIGKAVEIVGTIASTVFNIIANVLAALKPLINTAIDGINLVIRGLNIIKTGKDIPYLQKIGDSFATGGVPSAISQGGNGGFVTPVIPGLGGGGGGGGGGTGGGGTGGGGGGGGGGGIGSPMGATSMLKLVDRLTDISDKFTDLQFLVDTGGISKNAGIAQLNQLTKEFDVLSKQADRLVAAQPFAGSPSSAGMLTVNFNGIVGDGESVVRSLVELVNDSEARGTLGALKFAGL